MTQLNWQTLINVLLLTIIVLGAWFTTFSGPINEKFASQKESVAIALTAANDKIILLQQQMDRRINGNEKRLERLESLHFKP